MDLKGIFAAIRGSKDRIIFLNDIIKILVNLGCR